MQQQKNVCYVTESLLTKITFSRQHQNINNIKHVQTYTHTRTACCNTKYIQYLYTNETPKWKERLNIACRGRIGLCTDLWMSRISQISHNHDKNITRTQWQKWQITDKRSHAMVCACVWCYKAVVLFSHVVQIDTATVLPQLTTLRRTFKQSPTNAVKSGGKSGRGTVVVGGGTVPLARRCFHPEARVRDDQARRGNWGWDPRGWANVLASIFV